MSATVIVIAALHAAPPILVGVIAHSRFATVISAVITALLAINTGDPKYSFLDLAFVIMGTAAVWNVAPRENIERYAFTPLSARTPVEHFPGATINYRLANRLPRYFARQFDFILEFFFLGVALFVVITLLPTDVVVRWLEHVSFIGLLAVSILSFIAYWVVFLLLVMVFDATIYAIFGNTLGKALLGLKVGDLNAQPLSFLAYLMRNFSVSLSGLGLGLPVIQPFTAWYQFRRIGHGLQASYDEKYGTCVRQAPIGALRRLAFCFCFFTLFLILAFAGDFEKSTNRMSITSKEKADWYQEQKFGSETIPKLLGSDEVFKPGAETNPLPQPLLYKASPKYDIKIHKKELGAKSELFSSRAEGYPHEQTLRCNFGYKIIENKCVAIDKPQNSMFNAKGDGWICLAGYKRNNDECDELPLPPVNATYFIVNGKPSERWECKIGYAFINGKCISAGMGN